MFNSTDFFIASKFCIFKGHEKIAELLIKAGADLNIASDNGWTALHWASLRGS